MPENNLPSAKPDPEVASGEFDFAAPVTNRPRVKRRALQDATAAKPVEASPAKPAPTASSSPTRPAATAPISSQPSSSTASVKPKTVASTQVTSPHGTRPATLYYTSSPRQDKETTSSMKSTPAATPSPSTSAPSTPATRPAAATTRPASVVDYRTNVDRQSREQKSVGGVLTILVYALIVVFILGFSLAGYGAYVITKQLDKQSVTMSDFDKRYASDYKDINARLSTTQDTLAQAQAQIGRQQELIVRQQDTINKLLAAMEDTSSAIKTERAARAQETASLRSRLRDLEYQGTTTRKY